MRCAMRQLNKLSMLIDRLRRAWLAAHPWVAAARHHRARSQGAAARSPVGTAIRAPRAQNLDGRQCIIVLADVQCMCGHVQPRRTWPAAASGCKQSGVPLGSSSDQPTSCWPATAPRPGPTSSPLHAGGGSQMSISLAGEANIGTRGAVRLRSPEHGRLAVQVTQQ